MKLYYQWWHGCLLPGIFPLPFLERRTKTPKQPALTPDKLSTSRVSNFLEPHHTEMLICAKCSNFSRNAIKTKIPITKNGPLFHENPQFGISCQKFAILDPLHRRAIEDQKRSGVLPVSIKVLQPFCGKTKKELGGAAVAILQTQQYSSTLKVR